MATRRGNRHEVTVDGQMVWLDSLTEEVALLRFIETYGFTGKWERPAIGVKHGGKYYTPDFELAVADGRRTSRAIVEVKQYRRDCVKDTRERMCAIAKHYETKYVYLYAVKKDEWFLMNEKNCSFVPCEPPIPGELTVPQLWKPLRFKTTNYYGRHYYQSIFAFDPPPKSKRRRKRKSSSWWF